MLFFNGMNGDAEYLDYVTGDVIRGQSLVSMFPTLIDDLHSSLQSTPEHNNLAPVSPQKTETSRDGASVAEGKVKESADLFGALAGLIGKPIDGSTPPTLVNPRVQPNSGKATIGHVILNRYEVRRVLGRGAFGQVLEVHDRDTGMDYALKRLPPELAGHEAQLKLIRTNFSLVSQLSHPHIATLRTIETDPANGQIYVLMDLVCGMDLCSWMADYQASGAEFSIEIVLGIAEQIAAGLDFAHSRPINRGGDGKAKKFGVVHRDLKPANVMVEASENFRPGVPRVRIVDFGLAAEIQASMFSLSTNHAPNVIGGTPLYMAPEQ